MLYWLEQTEAEVPPGNCWLSAGEAAVLAGMRFPKRSADWRLGRWTAKRAVAARFDLPGESEDLANIEIRAAPSGAPQVLIARCPHAASISLSHRAGAALCAVADSDTEVGCDLELIEQHSDCFLIDYFTTEECKLLVECPPRDRPRLSTLLWCAKESTLKALQVGLRADTRDVAVTLGFRGASPWNPLAAMVKSGRTFHGWWRIAGGLVRTVVADPPPAPPVELEVGKGANHSAVPARF